MEERQLIEKTTNINNYNNFQKIKEDNEDNIKKELQKIKKSYCFSDYILILNNNKYYLSISELENLNININLKGFV